MTCLIVRQFLFIVKQEIEKEQEFMNRWAKATKAPLWTIPALFLVASPASAETPSPFGNLITSMTGKKAAPATQASPTASFRYTSDAARRKANQAKAVAGAADTYPALAEVYRTLTSQADIHALISDYLGKYGMRADDLGDVIALYWFSSWQIADGGKTDDPTKAQIASIRTQIGSMGPELKALSDADKQALADALILDMAVQQGVLEEAKESSPNLVTQLANSFTENNSKLFNTDFASLQLTPKGFVAKPIAQAAALHPSSPPSTQLAPAAGRDGSKTINATNILGVKFDSQLLFVAGGPAGSLNRTERVMVLFKDGTACYDCLSDLLDDPTLAKYRAEDPTDIGRWRKAGNVYYIRYPESDDEAEVDADMVMGPAPAGTTLSGNFETSGGMTVGGVETYTMSSWSEDLRFTPDGRFSWGKDSAIQGGAYGTSYVGSKTGKPNGGRYRISGYTITLDFDDGRSETKSFVYFPRERDFIVIDDSAYWIPDD